MKKLRQLYHGWLIQLMPKSRGYSFKCWIRGEKISFSDGKTYPTFVQALATARNQADLQGASLAIVSCLHEFYQSDQLSADEYGNMASSIVDFVTSPNLTEMENSSTLYTGNQILCYYKNKTGEIQIARSEDIAHWRSGEVVFPGEQLLFEACSEGELEIYSVSDTGLILTNKIPCSDMQVHN
jgi:Domain of unknown function (DUF1830)